MPEAVTYYLVYDLIGFADGDRLGSVVHFFLYDAIKILALIFLVVSFIAFLRTFVKSSSLKEKLSRMPFGVGNLFASLFGAVTPFCSCSSIPLFIGFLKAQVPLGIAFSFLITSPLVNEVAFVIMGNYFGWKLALLYVISGVLLGVIAGLVLGVLKIERHIILDEGEKREMGSVHFESFKKRFFYSLRAGYRTFKKIYPYVLGGVFIGALVHGYVPQEFFTEMIGKYGVLSVPLAVIVGVPVYAGCSTVVPVIFSITAHGIPLGTSLAFMMSIAGLSLPEAIILKRVMSMKLLGLFFGIVALGIVMIGYLFNAISSL